MNRREILQALAGLAGTRWAAEGYDSDDLDEWDPIDRGGVYGYSEWEFDVETVLASTSTPHSQIEVGWEEFTEKSVNVYYDSDGVLLDFEGSGDGTRGGALAELTPDVARDVAVALYMAAEELEQRGQT